jgi:hypothetical protein
MSVGQIYLVATTQRPPLLNVMDLEPVLLDLTRTDYSELTKTSEIVETVKKILAGSPTPADFPDDRLLSPLEVYPFPATPH